jgi:hypothetical protein
MDKVAMMTDYLTGGPFREAEGSIYWCYFAIL